MAKSPLFLPLGRSRESSQIFRIWHLSAFSEGKIIQFIYLGRARVSIWFLFQSIGTRSEFSNRISEKPQQKIFSKQRVSKKKEAVKSIRKTQLQKQLCVYGQRANRNGFVFCYFTALKNKISQPKIIFLSPQKTIEKAGGFARRRRIHYVVGKNGFSGKNPLSSDLSHLSQHLKKARKKMHLSHFMQL